MKKLFLPFLPAVTAFLVLGLFQLTAAQTDDESFDDILGKFRQSRQAFKDVRAQEANDAAQAREERVQAKRELAEQRRQEARERMEEKRKEVLLRLLDIQIRHLSRTRDRVDRMPNISDELKAQLATEIDTDIARLQGYVPQVEIATGREAIRALALEIKDFFKSYRQAVQMIVDAIHASRLNDVAATAGDRVAAMKAKVEELKSQGKDTGELEQEVDDIQGDLENVQEQIGRKAFREANEDLKGVYQKFRNIAQKARGLE